MHTDDIRTFVAVVDRRSISAAARELHITQPAVTRRVQRLEDTIGAPLIDRRQRPFALTDAGRAALERCRRLLATADELRSVAAVDSVPVRELRVGVAHALTELALIEPVDDLRRAYPGLSVQLHTGWSRDLLDRVESGRLDSAVILLPRHGGAPADVTARLVAQERLAVVAPRTWRRAVYAVEDLAQADWILNPEGCGARAALQRELARAGLGLRVAVETYNYELQLRLIARGRGIGLVPARLLKRSRSRSQVRALRVPGLAFPLGIWVMTGEVTPGARAVLSVFEQVLARRLGTAE